MRNFLRIGLVVVQIVVFLVVLVVSARVYADLTAKTYRPGDTPSRQFPLIAVLPRDAAAKVPEYRLVRWSELEEVRRKNPQLSFNLPQREAQFALEKQGGFVPQVRFKVLESNKRRQLVEVFWSDDDYDRHARYSYYGATFQPEYFKVSDVGSAVVGILPGALCAWLLGWLVRRKWLKDPKVA